VSFLLKKHLQLIRHSQARRSDWGMKTGIPFVSDAVRLKISVAFEKAA
jgi:hypothetical protein